MLIAIRYEERDLIKLFGDDYERYRLATGMLAPQVGKQGRLLVAWRFGRADHHQFCRSFAPQSRSSPIEDRRLKADSHSSL